MSQECLPAQVLDLYQSQRSGCCQWCMRCCTGVTNCLTQMQQMSPSPCAMSYQVKPSRLSAWWRAVLCLSQLGCDHGLYHRCTRTSQSGRCCLVKTRTPGKLSINCYVLREAYNSLLSSLRPPISMHSITITKLCYGQVSAGFASRRSQQPNMGAQLHPSGSLLKGT